LGIFINWLYTKTLVWTDGTDLDCEELLRLWIYGSIWSVPVLQNHALRELNKVRVTEKKLPSKLFEYIWKPTDTNSPLRRYIVDTWPNHAIRTSGNYPQELLFEIVRKIRTRPQKPNKTLSANQLEKYYASEKYCPLPLSDSEDESSPDDDSESTRILDNGVPKLSNPEADSMKRKRPELEELSMKPWGFRVRDFQAKTLEP
jgi:hypothetical protein